MRILIVEDEATLAEAVAEVLRDARYAVDLASTGDEADEMMAFNDYDLVLLDWTIPGPSGIELLRQWRGAGLDVPVLMLTGHDSVEDRIDGLDHGADDYLTKPFAFAELLARVRSLLRRRSKTYQGPLEADDLVMDRAAHRVELAGKPVKLSPKEFALLEYLLTRKGEVVSRSDISEHVWDATFDTATNTIEVILHRLRKKVDGARPEKLIHTVKGFGYVLQEERS